MLTRCVFAAVRARVCYGRVLWACAVGLYRGGARARACVMLNASQMKKAAEELLSAMTSRPVSSSPRALHITSDEEPLVAENWS